MLRVLPSYESLTAAIVLLCCCVTSSYTQAPGTLGTTTGGPMGPPVELGCSVFVNGDWDYVRNESSTDAWESSCTGMVQRVRDRCGGRRVNFVPTHFWKDPGYGRGDPAATYSPTQFCYKFSTVLSITGECREPTADEIKHYETNMTECFKKAVELDFDIEITPHLDDGLGQGGWRNALDFDPIVKYGSWSYDEIMLAPLARALAAAAAPKTTVFFAMTGEMSLTVVKYPASYAKLAAKYKDPSFGGPKNIQMGVSLNFNKLYTVTLTPELVKSQNVPALEFQRMCDDLDFIGISSYSRWNTGFDFGRKLLEGATRTFMKEVKYLGVNLTDLINVKKKGFHLSEYGIGAGTCGEGTCKATSAEEVSDTPYYGIYGKYQIGMDPWQHDEVARFRLQFYNRTLGWLKESGGPTVRIDAAYVWTLASWDFAGISPESTSVEGSYYNKTVSDMVKTYNDWVAVTNGANITDPVKEPETDPVPTDNDTPDSPTTDVATPTPTSDHPPAVLPGIDTMIYGPAAAGTANAQNSSNTDGKAGNTNKKKSGTPTVVIIVAAVVGVVFFIIVASVFYVVKRMRQQRSVVPPPPPPTSKDTTTPKVSHATAAGTPPSLPSTRGAPAAIHPMYESSDDSPPGQYSPQHYPATSSYPPATPPRTQGEGHTIYVAETPTSVPPQSANEYPVLDKQHTIYAL